MSMRNNVHARIVADGARFPVLAGCRVVRHLLWPGRCELGGPHGEELVLEAREEDALGRERWRRVAIWKGGPAWTLLHVVSTLVPLDADERRALDDARDEAAIAARALRDALEARDRCAVFSK